MYTQCPECSSAFPVTVEVLRQAAGKVRCGSCGNVFNALVYLSESEPDSPPAVPEPEPKLPELKPDPGKTADDTQSTTLSAEQSAALLKTLDDLAGSDIQLEDTGVEWRLLGEEDTSAAEHVPLDQDFEAHRPSLLDAELSAELQSRRVDEVSSLFPTPVDEVLTAAGGTVVESPEVFDAAASQTIVDESPEVFEAAASQTIVDESPEVFEAVASQTIVDEELRFDDNTGLPDDYDIVDFSEQPFAPPEPSRDAPEPMANLQVELGFDDPGEWEDLLDEFGAGADSATSGKTETTPAGELEADAIDELQSTETSPAGGDDGAAVRVTTDTAEDSANDEDARDVPEAADTLTSGELIGPEIASSGADGLPDADAEGTEVGAPEDDIFALATAAPDDEIGSDNELLESASVESVDEAVQDTSEPHDTTGGDDGFDIFAIASEDYPKAVELIGSDDAGESMELDAGADAAGEAPEEDAAAAIPESGDEDQETSIDDDLFAAAFETEAATGQNEPAEPVMKPLSEEEQTINMMIDRDLLSIAVTDDDGFTSTIVGTKESFDAAIAEAEAEEQALRGESSPAESSVETIIMSGEGTESIREAARAEALKEEAAAMIAAAKAEEAKQQKKPQDWRMVAGIVALGLLLALQGVHFSRNALARVPAIYDVLAPVYERIGMPLTPAWEVTGWRVEKTKGSVGSSGEALNIYAEVGNVANAAMPYPVIGVSLLDRFEESIGSRTFDPGEYLAGNVDRLALVGTGQRFSAEMTIESPAAAASGFRLNICYREAAGKLRCAIEDFR